MLTSKEVSIAYRTVENVTGRAIPTNLHISTGDILKIDEHNNETYIQADSVNSLCRGLFLYQTAQKQGRTCSFTQKRAFSSCGLMLDVSRNAVLKVGTIKRIIDQLASCGLNLLLLYMEDVYEVPEYPYMGYLRGRYTQRELKEIDQYAFERGVEMVPCIQTLAHMRQFLQWDGAGVVADQPEVMLVDDERTLRFVEAEIETVSACFRSRRIHVGMDEAHGIGLGRYHALHGAQDRFDLLMRHLKHVVRLCEEKGLKPIMWSDMLFRLGSKENQYYDLDADIPPNVPEDLPHVQMCYWDYYHTEESFYDRMFERHAIFGDTVFAGGIWTWSGFLPNIKRTEATLKPALSSCLRHGIQTVFATLWGDDGAETNCTIALNQLPLLSEMCWQQQIPDPPYLQTLGESLTGIPHEVFEAMGHFYPDVRDVRIGKGLVWCDILFPLINFEKSTLEETCIRAEHALIALNNCPKSLEQRYSTSLFSIIYEKAKIISQLKKHYESGNKKALGIVANHAIPSLINKYEELLCAHRTLWERDMKRLGWEVICLRYGAVMERLRDVQAELSRYLSGELDNVEALEEETLNCSRWGGKHWYSLYVSPSASI